MFQKLSAAFIAFTLLAGCGPESGEESNISGCLGKCDSAESAWIEPIESAILHIALDLDRIEQDFESYLVNHSNNPNGTPALSWDDFYEKSASSLQYIDGMWVTGVPYDEYDERIASSSQMLARISQTGHYSTADVQFAPMEYDGQLSMSFVSEAVEMSLPENLTAIQAQFTGHVTGESVQQFVYFMMETCKVDGDLMTCTSIPELMCLETNRKAELVSHVEVFMERLSVETDRVEIFAYIYEPMLPHLGSNSKGIMYLGTHEGGYGLRGNRLMLEYREHPRPHYYGTAGTHRHGEFAMLIEPEEDVIRVYQRFDFVRRKCERLEDGRDHCRGEELNRIYY